MTKKRPELQAEELRPDGWERFEKAVDAAVKSGPKHRHKQERAATGVTTRSPSGQKKDKRSKPT